MTYSDKICRKGGIILNLLRLIDNSILDFIRDYLVNDVFDVIMSFFTHLGDMGFLWISIGIIMLLFKKTRKHGIVLLFSIGICALVSLVIMKPFFGRMRPYEIRGIEPKIAPPGGSSFPSGHTASSFGAAYAVYLYDKRWGVLAFAVAAIIAFSRMYFLVHYPTDIIMGVFVGMCCTLASRVVLNKFFEKY